MTTRHPFAVATREELWSGGVLRDLRSSWGQAVQDERGIVAIDARDESLVAACEKAIDRLRGSVPAKPVRARLVADARRENGVESVSATMTFRVNGLSILTTADHATRDFELLESIASGTPSGSPMDYRSVPMVWRNGSAAVLLHEAAGHAAEHGHAPVAWPPWLSIEAPLRPRRASFRDVPLQRMIELVARQDGAPFILPDPRIEVLLVAGGAYEPLTQEVALHISAADFVDGDAVRRLPPFEILEERAAVARALMGAAGDPLRYPGVVCSREGQELVVGSFAPVMVTAFR